ncbi:hypothetical protein [Nonomuraea sp. CA-141351]|uniref:WD40 repeat domain-containing protein n=1 Tax=Nonomuraea sp. CA-141351 TaxID=3239996 RepID=UPI003D9204FD
MARSRPLASPPARLARRSLSLVSTLATAAGLLVALSPAASAADTTTDLGVDYSVYRPGDLALGNGKVFVSSGDQLVVADTDGDLLGEVGGLTEASGLAMSQDGARLYAALVGPQQVVEIDTATLEITRSIDLPSYPCPTHLARSGEWLWVGYGCDSNWDGGVVGLDLTVTAPQPIVVASEISGAPLLAANGGTLVVGQVGTSPDHLFVYDVSGTPTMRGEIDGFTHNLDNLGDLVVTPDGSNFFSVPSAERGTDLWDANSLERIRSYAGDPAAEGSPSSVAISPDGAYVVVGQSDGADLVMYDVVTGATIHALDNLTVAGGTDRLAFSGTDVFAVKTTSSRRLHLWRVEDITFPASTLMLTPPPGGVVNQPLLLTGRLELPGGAALGAKPLTVTRRLPDGTTETLAGVTTAPDGTFTVTDTPAAGGAYTYTVLWEGDDHVRWSTASAKVTVKNTSSLTVTGPSEWPVGAALTLSGVLLPTPPPSGWGYPLTVKRTVTNANGTVTTTLPGVPARKNGTYSFSDRPAETGHYTYTVEWAGNAGYTPAKADHEVEVKESIE